MERFVSKFEEVLSEVPEEDQDVVGLDARAYMNMVGGCRPSDAARSAVRAYKNGTLTRETFCAARMHTKFYPNWKCNCGKHGDNR